jgi:hypothetical protein
VYIFRNQYKKNNKKCIILSLLIAILVLLYSINYYATQVKVRKLTGFVIYAAEILDKHDIPYWLDIGTALGAYRDGGVFDWDYDADINLTYIPNKHQTEAEFYKHAFEVLKRDLPTEYKLCIYHSDQPADSECESEWTWGNKLPPKNITVNDLQFEICDASRPAECHPPDLDIYATIVHAGFVFRTSYITELDDHPKLLDHPCDERCPVPYRFGYIGHDAVFNKEKGYNEKKTQSYQVY